MRDKMRRLSGTHGRGYRKHKAGSRGGVGNAGLQDHKRTTGILLKRKAALRRTTCIRDLQSKLDRYLRKGIVIKDSRAQTPTYHFPCGKLCRTYDKVLGTGQPSGVYRLCSHMRMSKSCRYKLEDPS